MKNNKQYKYSINTGVYEDMFLVNVVALFQNKIHKVINEIKWNQGEFTGRGIYQGGNFLIILNVLCFMLNK